MKILTFIFNWRGQYDKTIKKIDQLRGIGVEPIVYEELGNTSS
jgi:hypothetical protein